MFSHGLLLSYEFLIDHLSLFFFFFFFFVGVVNECPLFCLAEGVEFQEKHSTFACVILLNYVPINTEIANPLLGH